MRPALAAFNTVEVISLVGSIVSVVLAVFAIWQASTFYRWSDTASKEASDSARDIRASVERIEKLFDTFYADTFGLMKDTYADFRKHSWPTGGEKSLPEKELAAAAQRAASEKLESIREDLKSDLQRLTERESPAEETVQALRSEMSLLIDRAIEETRQIDQAAEDSLLRNTVLHRVDELRKRGQRRIEAFKFGRPFLQLGQLQSAFEELYRLRDEGVVAFTVDPEPEYSIPNADAKIEFDFE
jgi:hypothetical protein